MRLSLLEKFKSILVEKRKRMFREEDKRDLDDRLQKNQQQQQQQQPPKSTVVTATAAVAAAVAEVAAAEAADAAAMAERDSDISPPPVPPPPTNFTRLNSSSILDRDQNDGISEPPKKKELEKRTSPIEKMPLRDSTESKTSTSPTKPNPFHLSRFTDTFTQSMKDMEPISLWAENENWHSLSSSSFKVRRKRGRRKLETRL